MSDAGIFVCQRDIVVGIVDWKDSWPFEDVGSVTQSFFRPLAKYFLVSIATLLRQQEELATSQQALKALPAA